MRAVIKIRITISLKNSTIRSFLLAKLLAKNACDMDVIFKMSNSHILSANTEPGIRVTMSTIMILLIKNNR